MVQENFCVSILEVRGLFITWRDHNLPKPINILEWLVSVSDSCKAFRERQRVRKLWLDLYFSFRIDESVKTIFSDTCQAVGKSVHGTP